MGVYVALVKVAGIEYEPEFFDGENAVRDAWDFLATERMNYEDDREDLTGYSATKNTLDMLAAGVGWEDNGLDDDGTGSLYAEVREYSVQIVACAWTPMCTNAAEEFIPHPILSVHGGRGVPACERCAKRATS